MAGGVPISHPYVCLPRKSKVNIWKLRDVDYDQKIVPPVSSLSSSTNNCSSNESVMPESIENLISDRAKMDLSRAAKRAVQLQHQILLKDQIQFRRRHLKTSFSTRKKQKNQLPQSPRTEVCSAPPLLGSNYTHPRMHPKQPHQAPFPPKIVVIGASQKSFSGQSEQCDPTSSPTSARTPKSAEDWNETIYPLGQTNMNFTPRSMMSTDSSLFLGAYSPDAKMSDYGYKTNYSDTPRMYH